MKTTSWVTTLIGYIGGTALELGAYLTNSSDAKTHIIAIVLIAIGHAAKDWNASTPAATVVAAIKEEANTAGIGASLQKIIQSSPAAPPKV